MSSLANNQHCRTLHEKFKKSIRCAKYGGSTEATRRLLGQLPVCSQSFSNSPYLDLALFYYDDKWISPLERPKPCGDTPIKLVTYIATIATQLHTYLEQWEELCETSQLHYCIAPGHSFTKNKSHFL